MPCLQIDGPSRKYWKYSALALFHCLRLLGHETSPRRLIGLAALTALALGIGNVKEKETETVMSADGNVTIPVRNEGVAVVGTAETGIALVNDPIGTENMIANETETVDGMATDTAETETTKVVTVNGNAKIGIIESAGASVTK